MIERARAPRHWRRGPARGERGKRSVDRLVAPSAPPAAARAFEVFRIVSHQSNLGGREGTAVLGRKRERSRRRPTPPTPREVVSLYGDYHLAVVVAVAVVVVVVVVVVDSTATATGCLCPYLDLNQNRPPPSPSILI